MDAYDAIIRRRAIREFTARKITRKVLGRVCDAGRLAPTAANLQPLVFLVVDDPELATKAGAAFRWAARLPGWKQPPGKAPAAYIFILADREIRQSGYEYDAGLAAQSIMIAATASGLGSCCLAVADGRKAAELLGTGSRYAFTLAVALGYPAWKSKALDMGGPGGSTAYFLEGRTLMVPKRRLKDVVRFNGL